MRMEYDVNDIVGLTITILIGLLFALVVFQKQIFGEEAAGPEPVPTEGGDRSTSGGIVGSNHEINDLRSSKEERASPDGEGDGLISAKASVQVRKQKKRELISLDNFSCPVAKSTGDSVTSSTNIKTSVGGAVKTKSEGEGNAYVVENDSSKEAAQMGDIQGDNNTTWRCVCETGFLPPGLLKSFGGVEAMVRMGAGQCYHKI